MKKSWRFPWYARVLAGLLTLVVLIVFLGPTLIPTGTLKRELIQWTYAKTGLTLRLKGPVEVTIFPTLGLSLDRLELMNPNGFPDEPLIRIRHASIQAGFLSLLAGSIRISETTLKNVHLSLRRNRAGVSNVAGLLQAISGSTPRTGVAATTHPAGGFALHSLGLIDFENIDILYHNQKTGSRESIRGLDLQGGPIERLHPFPLSFGMRIHSNTPKLNFALRLRTSVVWTRGLTFRLEQPDLHVTFLGLHPLTLRARARNLEIAPERGYIDLSRLNLSGPGLVGSLSVHGTLTPVQTRDLRGRIRLRLSRLKPWLGEYLAALLHPRSTHPTLTFGTGIRLSGDRMQLTACGFTLGPEKIAGNLDAALGTHPVVDAAFAGNALALTRAVSQRSPPNPTDPLPTHAPKSTSRAPFWKVLGELDGQASVRLGEFRYGTLAFTHLDMDARLNRGTLRLDPLQAMGFDGVIALRGSLRAPHGAPAIHLHLVARKLSLEALFAALGFGQLAALNGRLSTGARASFTGLSKTAIGRTLTGQGHISIVHALWRGVDLKRIVAAVAAAFHGRIPPRWPTGGETHIGTLAALFTLHHAEINLRSASFATTGLRATGRGEINWMQPRLDLQLLLHPLSGKRPGGIPWPRVMRGVAIPVAIQGLPSAPHVTPDMRSLLKSAARSKLRSLAHHLLGRLIPH